MTVMPPRSRAWLALGSLITLVLPCAYVLLVGPLALQQHWSDLAYALAGTAVLWLCALSAMAVVRFGERMPLTDLGFSRPTGRELLLAVCFGIGLSLLVPLLSQLAAMLIPTPLKGGIFQTTTEFPAWFLLVNVISVAYTEEVLFRAYPLERFRRPGGFPAIGVLLGLGAFVLLHTASWNAAHVVGVVVPLGVALTALYLWKRNVWVVMIVHLLIDLPLVVIAFL